MVVLYSQYNTTYEIEFPRKLFIAINEQSERNYTKLSSLLWVRVSATVKGAGGFARRIPGDAAIRDLAPQVKSDDVARAELSTPCIIARCIL